MLMIRDYRTWLFYLVTFSLGSIHVLYSMAFFLVLLYSLAVNIKTDFKDFLVEVRKEWKYLMLPVVGCLYLVVHYFCLLLFDKIETKVSWKMLEILLLYFCMIPLYLVSVKKMMTPLVLWRALKFFCCGVLLFNFIKLFCVVGGAIFTEPSKALTMLYELRFGQNMQMLGGFVYLEPQAVYICISALISYFALLKYDRRFCKRSELFGNVVILFFSLVFLSFTVAKGAILSFCIGMLFLTLVYFWKKSLRFKLAFITVFMMLSLGISVCLPDIYINRFNYSMQEYRNVQAGNFVGSSLASRYGLMKENFSHLDEFGVWGLGVCTNSRTDDWYANSPYISEPVMNSHNTFVEYWLYGGIWGVLFILYYFFAPIIKMVCKKYCLYFAVAVILSLFVAANTCVIAYLEDSLPIVVFILSMCYLCQEHLLKIQNNELM